jgi:hypothetical protein
LGRVECSGAVAKAIATATGAAFPEDYEEYNRHVYKVSIDALECALRSD